MERTEHVLPEGLTVEQMLALVQPDPTLISHAHVFIGPDRIPREFWNRVRPKAGTHITIRVLPSGGIVRTILSIAVIAAAVIAPQLLFTSAFLATTAGTLAAAAVSGGIALAGSLLVNAIAPPTQPKLGRLGGTAGVESPTYSIEGARNESRLFGRVLRVAGEHRVTPPYAARPYTEIVGDDEFVRMLFCWSVGPVEVADRKIGETPLSSFTDVEREFRRGYQASQITDNGAWDASTGAFPTPAVFGDKYTVSVAGTVDSVAYAVGDTIIFNGLAATTSATAWDQNGDKPLTLYTNDVFQEDLAIALTQSGGRETRTTQPDADEISVDVTFDGLVVFNNAGTKLDRTVEILVEYRAAGTADPWTTVETLTVTSNRSSPVRAGSNWSVPTGQYQVGLTRLTADSSSTQILDTANWTALRTIKHQDPVAEPGLALEAVRIKATGELNRVVDSYNGVVTSIVLDWDGADWVYRKSRRPASLFRTVLQDAGNPRPVADAKIDLVALQDWHDKNVAADLSFDAVIDFDISARELLQDIASAGRAGPVNVDGKWSVAVEEPKPVPVQHFTPRNSFGFTGRKVFRSLPHGLRMRFPNREKGYRQDERIVYRDGFDASNATEFEGLEQFGITDPRQIWIRGREQVATAVLRPELYSLSTDIEFLVCQRGDPIRVTHDVILVGLATGRVKAVQDDGMGNATGVTADEVLVMELGKSYVLRFRKSDGSSLLQAITTATGGVTAVTFTAPIPLATAPADDDLFMFGETGKESIEAIVTGIRPRADLTAEITFVDAAPEIGEAAEATRDFVPGDVNAGTDRITIAGHPYFNGDITRVDSADTLPGNLPSLTDLFVVGRTDDDFQLSLTEGGAAIDITDGGVGTHTISRQIPPFDSNISAPANLAVPVATNARSDGTVLFRAPDGSYVSRILLTLSKPLDLQTGILAIEARFRESASAGPYTHVTVQRDAGEMSLMPVEDGLTYAYQLRYVLRDGEPGDWSAEATHLVLGKSAPPNDVTGFAAQQNGNVVTFSLDQVPDLDVLGYEIRRGPTGVAWDDADEQATKGGARIGPKTRITTASVPPGVWDFLIKAIDTSENESANAARTSLVVISTFDIIEQPEQRELGWPGTRIGFVYNPLTGALNPDSTVLASTDTAQDVFDEYVWQPVSSASYEAPEINIGFDDQVRVWAEIASAPGPGEAGANAATLEVDYRAEAGAYDGFESWTIAEVTARRFKFKMGVTTAAGVPRVTGFKPTVDLLEETVSEVVAVDGTGVAAVTFPTPFHLVPNIEVSAEAGAAGGARFATWEAVTTTGFTVRLFDQAGTAQSGNVTYRATGV